MAQPRNRAADWHDPQVDERADVHDYDATPRRITRCALCHRDYLALPGSTASQVCPSCRLTPAPTP